MISIRWKRPSPADLDAFRRRAGAGTFSYGTGMSDDAHVGMTIDGLLPPSGWTIDRNRVELGQGRHTFDAACQALRDWAMFRLGWVGTHPPGLPIEPGEVVAVVARVFGVWLLNACRIVAVIDETTGPVARWGFAYGTLPEHAERGEERFLIEWDRDTDAVHYDILAVSRPADPLVRIGFPVARIMQRRFALDSKRAMRRAASTDPTGR